MTNKEKEEQMLGELASKPICWYLERPAKIKQLLDWQVEFPLWCLKSEVVAKYLAVLRASGLERCEYCGLWVNSERLVRVTTVTWNPAASVSLCCESTCEIDLLCSR